MKLSDWAGQWDILELNALLPAEKRWPNLDRLFRAAEDLPRVSSSSHGFGIFIGWRDASGWAYHHGICLPSLQVGGKRCGFHEGHSKQSMIEKYICPTFNVGDLPESKEFRKLLRSVGIEPAYLGSTMVTPKLIKGAA